jgi:hypothetical protein
MDDPLEAKYEDYIHQEGDESGLREEFDRRQQAGWSLWKIDPLRGRAVRMRFKHPSDWAGTGG